MKNLETFTKNYDSLSKKEMNSISGGRIVRFMVTNEKNMLGLPKGMYFRDPETGRIWNVLGKRMY
ncbi:hypothetical protein DS884_01900 [Tenacibaculum sp. E3R01]|uniref:bacteriocin n=1 Tax=Tenacibaculum sp. E3R01 TaxID=2267227 RepID=UPI000DEAB8B1|nr:bacteriocin [Tenacibaculum sp. E3R01]RBW62375.1 hypothetical protein DS884_01900 [Tenacibaculum sp. E3R01]